VKIAIVEDSDYIRKNLIKFISAIKGAEVVVEAEDVGPAIIVIEEKKPDIVVLSLPSKAIQINNHDFNRHYKTKTVIFSGILRQAIFFTYDNLDSSFFVFIFCLK
jgi:chemotaxis response regulator CheB